MLSKFGLGPKPGGGQAGPPPGQTTGGGGGAKTSPQNSLSGYWQVAFQVGTQTLKANMHLKQDGNSFVGEGTDDPSGREFVIEEGQVKNNEVLFYKKYPGMDPSQAPPVEYSGTLELIAEGDAQGPYLSGTYATTYQGKPVTGDWEAQMTQAETAQAGGETPAGGGGGAENPPPEQAPPVDPSKAPHLSGKWNVGYEYNFKTIQSDVFIEQDGGKLTGHGSDRNTKEKFAIEKGWYNYPRITIVRKYVKGKGAAADRTMTFKGEVSVVSDDKYQGPYMQGKTQGGGAWEAEMYK